MRHDVVDRAARLSPTTGVPSESARLQPTHSPASCHRCSHWRAAAANTASRDAGRQRRQHNLVSWRATLHRSPTAANRLQPPATAFIRLTYVGPRVEGAAKAAKAAHPKVLAQHPFWRSRCGREGVVRRNALLRPSRPYWACSTCVRAATSFPSWLASSGAAALQLPRAPGSGRAALALQGGVQRCLCSGRRAASLVWLRKAGESVRYTPCQSPRDTSCRWRGVAWRAAAHSRLQNSTRNFAVARCERCTRHPAAGLGTPLCSRAGRLSAGI